MVTADEIGSIAIFAGLSDLFGGSVASSAR